MSTPGTPVIAISLGVMKESNGRTTYMVIIARGDHRIETDHTTIKGRAEYSVACWKHVLLSESKPNLMDYNTDPIDYDALELAARNFIAKVDNGEAKSVRSYNEFKKALGE